MGRFYRWTYLMTAYFPLFFTLFELACLAGFVCYYTMKWLKIFSCNFFFLALVAYVHVVETHFLLYFVLQIYDEIQKKIDSQISIHLLLSLVTHLLNAVCMSCVYLYNLLSFLFYLFVFDFDSGRIRLA